MNAELFIVTGTSGTGKSTITPILQKELSKDYRAYDWDEILRPYDGTEDIWVYEVAEKMFQIVQNNITEGVSTVVLGLIKPAWIRKYQDQLNISKISFCLLDVSVSERTRRLKERNAPEYLINDLEELEGLPQWIQESGFDNCVIDTSDINTKEVAKKVIEWIQTPTR